MPVYLDEADVISQATGFKSVLIVPCRFCPAASMAVKTDEPYIEFFRRFLTTASYARFIDEMKHSLETRGVRTGVFESKLLHQFVLCMWTSRRRKKLLERARNYEAVIVLGCDAAVRTVRSALESDSHQVIQGMTSRGIMGVKPSMKLPFNLRLELESVTPMPDSGKVI